MSWRLRKLLRGLEVIMGEFVWLNGAIVPKEKARVSIVDRGLLYGDGLFETMRSYGGRLFRLDEHLDRLFHSAEAIKLRIPYSLAQLRGAIYRTIEVNGVGDGYVRLTVSRGEGGARLDPPKNGAPTTAIVVKDPVLYSPQQYEVGFKAIVATIRCNEFSQISGMKSLNFLPNILARMEARARGVDEVILLNTSGYLAEAAVSNIFLIKGKSLLTPSMDCGILPGITRKAILELAPNFGLEVVEKWLQLTELKESSEAFLTNSLMEVMALVEVDGASIGNEKPGPITVSLHRAYREFVESMLS